MRRESARRLAEDRDGLQRFVHWIGRESTVRWRILFTPWGEALVRSWYREAIAELSGYDHVTQVAVQTNLSCGLDWLTNCIPGRVALWAAFHPEETTVPRFAAKVLSAEALGASVAPGAVAVTEHLPILNELRTRLPPRFRLWINARQPRPRPYTSTEIADFSALDPEFEITRTRQPSWQRPCQAGETVFTVDGAGDLRRCHFVSEVIGNIADPNWNSSLQPRLCPRRFCDCYLGTVPLTRNPDRDEFIYPRLQFGERPASPRPQE